MRILLIILLITSCLSVNAQDKKKLFFFLTQQSGSVNNEYVQTVIDKASADGFGSSVPNATTISALNTFFNTIDPVMSKAEMIKITRLNDMNSQEFSKYNFVDPTLYKSTYSGTIIYSLKGVSSDGSSYINDGITMKRRAGLNTNSSSIAVTEAFSDVSLDQAVCGSVSGNYYIMRPYFTGASSYYFAGLTNFGVTDTKQNVFSCMSTDGVGGTKPRFLQNTTYKDNSSNLGAEMTSDIAVYTCAYNNAGTAIRFYTGGNIGFRWEGYELIDSEKELIRDAWNQYVIDVSATFTETSTLTSDGREAFLIIGDSKTGTSNAVGARAAPNTVLQYNRTSGLIQEVLGSDLLNVPSTGSMWPSMGTGIYEGTNGKRPVFILSGVGGSSFLNSFASASYDDGTYPTYTGTAYATAKTRFDAGLSALGKSAKGIFLILGVNDINRTEPLVSLQAQINSMFTRLRADYGATVPIYISLPQKPSGAAEQPGRLDAIRAELTAAAAGDANIYVVIDEVDIFAVPSYISGTHFSYDGNIYWANTVLPFVLAND
jgi:hypothetical protein